MSDQKVKTSTQLWSHQVGMLDDGANHEWGYEWSNGQKFKDGKGVYGPGNGNGHGHGGGGPVYPVLNATVDTRQGQRITGFGEAAGVPLPVDLIAIIKTAQQQATDARVKAQPSVDSITTAQWQVMSGAADVTGQGTVPTQPSNDPIAIGSQIAPLTIQNLSTSTATNQPFKIGHVFARGHLPANGAAISLHMPDGTAIPSQLNVKALHSDGSVRHAMVAGIVPAIAAGGAVTLSMHRAASPQAGAAIAPPSQLPKATANISGVLWTADASTVQPFAWINGPVASDYLYDQVPFRDPAGVAHPTLKAQFSVLAFATGDVRVDHVIEHCQAYSSTADITYDGALYMAGQQVYAKTGLVHTPTGRWKKTFWQGSKPVVHIKLNIAYLLDSKQVPNYDRKIVVSETLLNNFAADLAIAGKYDPMAFGRWQPYMPNTGGRPDIGPMPDSYAALLLSMDKRAWDIVMASADLGGSWPMYRRDSGNGPGRGYPLSVTNFPYVSIAGSWGDCLNPVTKQNEHLPALTSATKGVPDSSHQPSMYYLPYLLTGDYYYLEGLQFAACFNTYQDNPYYRDFAKALVKADQLRGQGWSLRTLAQCVAITPEDHYLKSHFRTWYDNNMKWYLDAYIDAPNPAYANQLGIITNGYSLSYTVNGQANTGMAPWMDDFFTQGLGIGYELLELETSRRLLMWKAQFQIGRMNDPEICSINACSYSLGVRSTASSPWFGTLAECFHWSISDDQEQYPCGSPQRMAFAPNCLPGDIDGYPASESGYPSNYQPALAMAVDVGYPGGAAAWTKFITRPTKPNYGALGPQFAVVPRTV